MLSYNTLDLNSYKIVHIVESSSSFKELTEKAEESMKGNNANFLKELNGNEIDPIELNDKCILCDLYFLPQDNNEADNEGYIEIDINDENSLNNNISKKSNILSIVDSQLNNNINTNTKAIEEDELAKCPHCKSLFHIICLAKANLPDEYSLIPGKTLCNICSSVSDWGEFITIK